MLQVMRKLLIVVLVGLLVSGCEGMTTREGTGAGIGGILGAIGGNVLADKLGLDRSVGTALGAAAGAAIGMQIGAALDKYFGENDKKNLQNMLRENKSQKVAWCSDKEGKPSGYSTPSRNVKAVQCGSGNKVVQSLGVAKPVKVSGSEDVCRAGKTEIMNNSGVVETIPTTFCKRPDGTSYEKTSEKAA